jgi:hypothetical protein
MREGPDIKFKKKYILTNAYLVRTVIPIQTKLTRLVM